MKSALFVINLDRSPQRLAATRTQAEALGLALERVPAVDGTKLTEAELQHHYCADRNRRDYHSQLSAGEIGCYLSHRRAWQLILERDLDYAVILEDDVILEADFGHALDLLPQAGRNWDVIKLGAVKRRPIVDFRLLGGFGLCRYKKTPISAYAQVVSRLGAQKLLQREERFSRPVDVDLQHVWEHGLEIFGLEPFPVRIRADEASEIGDKPRRSFFGPNSCLRLYRHRLRFAWQTYLHNFLHHGIGPTLGARRFSPALVAAHVKARARRPLPVSGSQSVS